MKNFVKTLCASGVLTALLSTWASPALAGKVLDGVKQRGVVTCGVNTGRDGFSEADGKGVWSGIDVDYCKALAAAVLGDANKVKFVPTSGQTRITALQSGEIDVLARNTTWTLSREAASGLVWVGVNFYDGQAFMLKKRPDVSTLKDLNASTICVDAGSTTERNLADYFRANSIAYKAVSFDKPEAALQGFISGRCQVMTRDYASLAAVLKTDLKDTASEYVILPQLISKEPLGPVVRRGDEEWHAIAKWTLYAMIEAEELGLSSTNIDQMKSSTDVTIRRFVGTGTDMGKDLGLDKEWGYRIVKQVGNYGESYDRNLGMKSTLKLPRGRNELWSKGGLMFAPPIR